MDDDGGCDYAGKVQTYARCMILASMEGSGLVIYSTRNIAILKDTLKYLWVLSVRNLMS